MFGYNASAILSHCFQSLFSLCIHCCRSLNYNNISRAIQLNTNKRRRKKNNKNMLMNLIRTYGLHIWNENKSFSLHKREQPQMLRSLLIVTVFNSRFISLSLDLFLSLLRSRSRAYVYTCERALPAFIQFLNVIVCFVCKFTCVCFVKSINQCRHCRRHATPPTLPWYGLQKQKVYAERYRAQWNRAKNRIFHCLFKLLNQQCWSMIFLCYTPQIIRKRFWLLVSCFFFCIKCTFP